MGEIVIKPIHNVHKKYREMNLVNHYIFGNGFDADANAFIVASTITDTVQMNAINNLVIALKAKGLWTKMKAIYPFVGGTAFTHKWNLKDPRDLNSAFRLTYSGTITHDSSGLKGENTGYSITYINPSVVLGIDNNALGVYSLTNSIVGSADIGCQNGDTQRLSMEIKAGSTQGVIDFYNFSNDRATLNMNGVASTGLFVANRSSNVVLNGWRNGVKLTSNLTTRTSQIPTENINIGCSSPNFRTSRKYAFAFVSLGLTDTNVQDLYTAVQTYQTALGRQV